MYGFRSRRSSDHLSGLIPGYGVSERGTGAAGICKPVRADDPYPFNYADYPPCHPW